MRTIGGSDPPGCTAETTPTSGPKPPRFGIPNFPQSVYSLWHRGEGRIDIVERGIGERNQFAGIKSPVVADDFFRGATNCGGKVAARQGGAGGRTGDGGCRIFGEVARKSR